MTFTKAILRYCVFAVCVLISYSSFGQQTRDSLHYPLEDRWGDPLSWPQNNPFYLTDTSFIKQDIEYDPLTNEYYINEKIGDTYYRKPTYLTFDEFWALEGEKQETDYFNERSETLDMLNRRVSRPPMQVYPTLFDRIFGVSPNGLKVQIKPQGTVDITMGYQGQNIDNPTLPENARKTGGFDFNENADLNVIANIGDKLKLPISYNTLANFDFQNQLKLDYEGKNDEIIKSIQAGNISFQTPSTLMPSVQSLFGLSTQLQFGKLYVTAALAEQRSQTQSLTLQGGGVTQSINLKMDSYDENRDFLLGQYFVKNYDTTMRNLPIVSTQVQILRMEVWVTNRTGVTTNAREITGFMDLGESQPYNPVNIPLNNTNSLPDNSANTLYSFLANDQNNRNPALVNSLMLAKGLTPVNDYEITYARKLDSTEYYLNPQVGFICLNQQLQPNDVLAVAYQYTYNGRVYQVGEFSEDVALDTATGYQGIQKVLFLKLLKATSARVNLPIWQLMMKNVYSLNVTGLQSANFNLNIFYQQPAGGQDIYLPVTAPNVSGKTLLSILNLDRLNNQNDPQPDGLWDFVDGFTVLSQQGKIIFPVLQPFGRDLDSLAFAGEPQAIKQQYIYYPLYDSIQAIAQTYANLDRFVVEGTVKGSSTSEISLGAFNIPQGSVTVSAGGQPLTENVDYVVDYNLGTIKILNQAILNSGVPVNVQFENNATYGVQQRSFLGLRLNYLASKKLSVGATLERLKELPFFTKVNYGEDPIDNTMYGVDISYNSDEPAITRLLNKLPFYNTTAPSHLTAYGEGAVLKPGHPPQIGSGAEGLVYIDDFEGSTTDLDLRFPFVSWALASTPSGNGLFPEANLNNNLAYGYNRAKFAWYNIEPTLQDPSNSDNPLRSNLTELSDPRVRAVYTNELFPQETTDITDALLTTFDLAYYPTDRGPYNYVSGTGDVTSAGKLTNPAQRWGGIMRSLDETDFETDNVQYLEFWVQDPFIKNPLSAGGKLYIDLGDVSEDILKDGRRFYENGLNAPDQPSAVDSTSSVWGTVPVNPIQITNAFSNDPGDRPYQDVGFDGMNDPSERTKQSAYLNSIATNFGAASPVYQRAFQDPSNDDYVWYRDPSYDAAGTGILGRYKNIDNPEGNSPVASTSSIYSSAETLYPDNEDLDHDNTLNQTEQYYEYEVDLKPGMNVGTSRYIVQTQIVHPKLVDGAQTSETWYLFRVPITEYTANIGNVPDFKSIRFMRMYMTGFEDSVVMRFATLNLVRNAWRTFTYEVDTTGSYTPISPASNTTLNVSAVNVEENSGRLPIPYVIPPGIERVQFLSNNGVNLLQNEQSMSLKINNLAGQDARAVFKTFNLDLRQYGSLSMFIHAEGAASTPSIPDGQLVAVIRLGQDFLSNYYEIRIPLTMTAFNPAATADEIWPTANNLDFELSQLVSLKLQRNAAGASLSSIYRQIIGNKTFSVLGNPNLAQVQGILIAIENSNPTNTVPLNTEVWLDELRLSQLNEQGGYAALGRVDIQLADLGSLSVSANTYTYGFGSIDQSVNERAKNDLAQFDVAATIDAGKLFPKGTHFSIPVYASINRTVLTPHYDPYDQDVLYSYKLATAPSAAAKDSIINTALDQTTIKTINFTNVKFAAPSAKPKLWSLSNFDFSYSYTQIEQSNPQVIENNIKKYTGGFGYTFNGNEKYREPFKKLLIRRKSHWLDLVKDFNFNFTPALIGFRTVINRQLGIYIPRIVDTYNNKVETVDTTYDKYFTFDRYYNLRWDFTRSLNLDFTATNSSRIDEPYGLLNTAAKKDTVLDNFIKGGRNTLYQQQATISYNAPLSKLPLTDWINARYNYTTTYTWIGASLLALNFGNTIENSQQNGLTGEFDFTKLYSKSKFLNAVNTPQAAPELTGGAADSLKNLPSKSELIQGLKGAAKTDSIRKWRLEKRDLRIAAQKENINQPTSMNGLERVGGQLLTMVKRASVNYSSTYNSRIPGYMDSTSYLGEDFNSMEPGLDYVFGRQPDTSWLNEKAAKGLITRDSTFNLFYEQNLTQQLTLSAQLVPIKDFTIDVNLMKSFSKDYTEEFKDTTGTGNFFGHLSPLASGGFSVSYISFQTLFEKYNPNIVSQTFDKFQDNRIIIANRLAQSNPYWQGLPPGEKYGSDGFPTGYGRYAQDVLIPAFIAAYTNKNPNTISLINETNPNINSNPFSGIKPLPNWKITYTGLTGIPFLASAFSSITITHGYDATLSMNSFTSNLLYRDPLHLATPGFIDPTSGNFVPYYLVPNLTIQEEFAPLFGIDVTTTNQTNLQFSYKKSRQLSLSLLTYQLSEVNSTGWMFGGSIRKKGVNLPFKIPGFKKVDPKGNDLNIGLNFGVQNDTQNNSNLDQANAYSTGGQKVITIQPNIDYVLNKSVDLKLYYNEQKIIPYISTSAPVTNVTAGLEIRISLGQ